MFQPQHQWFLYRLHNSYFLPLIYINDKFHKNSQKNLKKYLANIENPQKAAIIMVESLAKPLFQHPLFSYLVEYK